MSWSWRRTVLRTTPWDGEKEVEVTEFAETDGLAPPEGDGWTLDGKFGVGKVKDAGDSPARHS